jgi:hypothetical protein
MSGLDFDGKRRVINSKYVSLCGRVERMLVGYGKIRNANGPSSEYNSDAGFPNIQRNKHMKKQYFRFN